MDVHEYTIYIMLPSEWFRSLGLCVKNLMFNQALKAGRSQMVTQFVRGAVGNAGRYRERIG